MNNMHVMKKISWRKQNMVDFATYNSYGFRDEHFVGRHNSEVSNIGQDINNGHQDTGNPRGLREISTKTTADIANFNHICMSLVINFVESSQTTKTLRNILRQTYSILILCSSLLNYTIHIWNYFYFHNSSR